MFTCGNAWNIAYKRIFTKEQVQERLMWGCVSYHLSATCAIHVINVFAKEAITSRFS